MIILRTKTFSSNFVQDGFYHSRRPDLELTEKTRDLGVSVSSYLARNSKGDMRYMDIWLNEDPSKFFWLGNFDSLGPANDTGWHGWGIHFRTFPDNFNRHLPENNRSVLGENEKQRLFEATSRVLNHGDLLSTYGTITPGGVHGLLRFGDLGFEKVGTAYPKDDKDKTKKLAVPIWKKI